MIGHLRKVLMGSAIGAAPKAISSRGSKHAGSKSNKSARKARAKAKRHRRTALECVNCRHKGKRR